jgi:hypothetical protein
VRAGRPVSLTPIHMEADLVHDAQGLEVRRLAANGAFGRLEGHGRLSGFSLDATMDLAKATQEAGQFVDLKERSASGAVTAKVTTQGAPAEGTRLAASLEFQDLIVVMAPDRRWQEPKASVALQADLRFNKENALIAFDVKDCRLVSSVGVLQAKANFQKQAEGWNFKGTAGGNGELAAAANQAAAYLGSKAAPVSGRWTLAAEADGNLGKVVNASMQCRTEGLAYAAKREAEAPEAAPVAVGDVRMEAAVSLLQGGKADEVAVRKLHVEGPGVQMDAGGKLVLPADTGGPMNVDGKADARIDMAGLADLLRSFGVVSAESRMAGKVTAVATASTQEGNVVGTAAITAEGVDVLMAETQTAIREPKAEIPVAFGRPTDAREAGRRTTATRWRRLRCTAATPRRRSHRVARAAAAGTRFPHREPLPAPRRCRRQSPPADRPPPAAGRGPGLHADPHAPRHPPPRTPPESHPATQDPGTARGRPSPVAGPSFR